MAPLSGLGGHGKADIVDSQLSDGDFDNVLTSALICKGFCVIELDRDTQLIEAAQAEVAELQKEGRFYQPPAQIAEGLLGVEGSAEIAEVRFVEEHVSLKEVDQRITNIGITLGPFTDMLGFDITHRSHALLHQAGVPGEGPALTEKDVTKWLEKFLRHTLMVVVFVGPTEGVLTLKVFGEDDAEPYEVRTRPGTMVVLRPDILSHHHVALGEALAVSSFFVHAHEFQKRHATGGWVMCPVAKELDRWAMERARMLKAQSPDAADWDSEIPRQFIIAMNCSYHSGNMVAVRGLSCKLPASWDADSAYLPCIMGPDFATNVPFLRWNHEEYYDANPECWRSGKTFSNHGAFIDGVDLFDPKKFSLSVAESRSMDPHQRHILEVGYESLNKMGMKKSALMNSAGSVYVGHSFGEYGFVPKDDSCNGPTGGAGCVAANRLSFVLGMKGPSMALDTDQSSSMSALFMASESIQKKGRGIVGTYGVAIGAQLMMAATWWGQHCAMGWMSIRGRCLTFDIAAGGHVRGEGFTSAAMKPFSDVVDGQYVRKDSEMPVGVLAGINLNTNGKGASLLAPNGMAEQEVIMGSVKNACIAAENMDIVECHGAGNHLADVIEVASVLRAHRCQDGAPLGLTSMKTLMGNTMETGGMCSFLKNLCSAQWGIMWGGLHLRELNPNMEIAETPALLLSEHLMFARRTAFTGTMSRGYGGTNGYAISWGTLDDQKLPNAPELPAGHQRIYFWPGGGGFLDTDRRPERGYFIVGSWMEWGNPQPLEEEGPGAYGYTVTLGENCWEQFQLLLDGDTHRVLHPGGVKVGKDTPLYGPEEGILGAMNWIIDGQPDWIEGPAPQEADALPGDDGQNQQQIIPVETPDSGKPGDKYRVHLRIAGKWRAVTWDKLESVQDDGPCPIECIGKYYVSSSWNQWAYDELQRDPNVKGLYSIDVKLPAGVGMFQIVRNLDPYQVLHPASDNASEDSDVLGPAEGGAGMYWCIKGRPGAVFRIELTRNVSSGEDIKKVSWKVVES